MDLAIFKYQDKEVRTIKVDNKTLFVAKDVFEVLNIAWRGAESVATIPDRMKLQVIDLEEYVQNEVELQYSTWLLNESGVYKVAFRSSKPEAEKFTDWIASDVLPSIRTTGGYISPSATNDQLTNLTVLIETVLASQQQELKELKEQTKLIPAFFNAGSKHKGCSNIVKSAMESEEEEDVEEVYLTVLQWLQAKGVTLSTTQLNTMRKRAAQFMRLGRQKEPNKINNRVVYHSSEFCYLEQALSNVLGLD